ncbi:hypothetical protein CPT76_14140 [Paenibacillus sp. AR247]|nr:hypothetical protein CPT76_14140 [Paenibacillus sp. AR247]
MRSFDGNDARCRTKLSMYKIVHRIRATGHIPGFYLGIRPFLVWMIQPIKQLIRYALLGHRQIACLLQLFQFPFNLSGILIT